MPKQTETITRFKGINRMVSATSQLAKAGFALDCLNVLPNTTGGNLEKLRCPVPLSATISGFDRGPNQFHMFESETTRSILAIFNKGGTVYKFSLDAFSPTLIDANATYAQGILSFVQANNLLFFSNGFSTPLKFNGTDLDFWGIQTPATVATLAAGAGSLTLVTGRKYRFSYKNSITGHVGTASSPSASSGAISGAGITLTIPAPAITDAQIDLVRIYATLDGGEDYFFLDEIGVAGTPFAGATYLDNIPDEPLTPGGLALDQAERAPLLNDQPTKAKFLVKWGARIFGLNIAENSKWIWYTGYNRIFVGRPEESVPPGNRLKLEIGADDIAGGGVVANGLVVWDNSEQMFQFRGQPEDIVFTAPVEFTLNLQQLPWKIGCASHFTVQSTPFGLVWLTPDHQVCIFDGVHYPATISGGVEPFMRRMTAEREFNSRAVYWSYEGREWYVLGIPIDGESQMSLILIFDLSPEDNAGVFPLNVGVFDSLGIVTFTDGSPHCLIGQDGVFKELLLDSTTTLGANVTLGGVEL